MEVLKTGWNFFQNEILGMQWLNSLIGNFLNACGLDTKEKIWGSVQFFLYDTIKIMVLLGVLILLILYIQSYFLAVAGGTMIEKLHFENYVEEFIRSGKSIDIEQEELHFKDRMGLSVNVEYVTDMQKIMDYGVIQS